MVPTLNGDGRVSRIPRPALSDSGHHSPVFTSPSTSGSSPRLGQYTQSPRVLSSSGSGSGSSNSHSHSHTCSPSPTSPRPDTPQFRPGTKFTQQSQLLQQQQQQRSTPVAGSGTATTPSTVSVRRRGHDDSPSTPIAGGRRAIPHPAPGSLLMPSPEISGLPRLSSLNHGSKNGQNQSPHSTPNPNSTLSPPMTSGPAVHRIAPRQVSTPTLGPNTIPRKPVTDPMPGRQRPRSQSAMSPSTPTVHPSQSDADPDSTPDAVQPTTKPQAQALTPVSGMADRVPIHIRVRLRLIHQLGIVLGLDAQGVAAKIDIPSLLARVDAAYDKGHADLGLGLGLTLEITPSIGSAGTAGGERNWGMMNVLKRMGGGGKVKAPQDEHGGHSPKTPGEGKSFKKLPGLISRVIWSGLWCSIARDAG